MSIEGLTHLVRIYNPSKSIYEVFNHLGYHAISVWYFTFSDLKTIVGPSTAFGSVAICAFPDVSNSAVIGRLVTRILLMAFWAWVNLLPFSIDNQRQEEAIKEDSLNKPWRPMPSKRMTVTQATRLMLFMYIIAIISSTFLGGLKQCLTLICLGFWYNDLHGADNSAIIRNFINGCGFVCYTSGALEVGLGLNVFDLPQLRNWFIVIFLIVFTTIQTQDMYDQAGDSERGRITVPLWLGDGAARWTIALPMALLWSWVPTNLWQGSTGMYLIPAALSGLIAWRTIKYRTVPEDRLTFKLWNVWMMILYTIPLQKQLAPGVSA